MRRVLKGQTTAFGAPGHGGAAMLARRLRVRDLVHLALAALSSPPRDLTTLHGNGAWRGPDGGDAGPLVHGPIAI